MSKKASPRAIGGFVIGAVVLVVAGVVLFGSGKYFQKTIPVISFFDGSVGGLNPGAPVKYRGVQIGEVTEVRLNIFEADTRRQDPAIPVYYAIDEKVVEKGTGRRFNAADLERLVEQGLRASLATESFVTGRKYIELDWHPDLPAHREEIPNLGATQVPTIRTGLEEIQREVSELIAGIGSVPIDSLVLDLRNSIDGIDRLVNSVNMQTLADSVHATLHQVHETFRSIEAVASTLDTTVAPLRIAVTDAAKDARQAAEQAERLIENVRGLVSPGAPLSLQLQQTLAEIASAAASLRVLTDYLERHPSAILRGKPEDK